VKLNAVILDAFGDYFMQLSERWRICVVVKRDYLEGK
jgi:hypothetical protein